MIKGVIFDVDGTLVDSVDLHAAAWRETFIHFGHAADFDAVRAQIGKGGDQIMPVFVPSEELEHRGDAIDAFRHDLFARKYMPQVRGFHRVRALFQRLRADGRRIALASSAKGDELAHYKRAADIDDLVDTETSSDDAERSKPHPDIFQAALGRLGLPKDEVVVVGDSPWDAQAAVNAGLRCIGLLCGGFAASDLRAAGCEDLYANPEDLLRHIDRSLIGRG
ncbi:MAG TPA: HAD family hydrolase [Azospirillum sp.]